MKKYLMLIAVISTHATLTAQEMFVDKGLFYLDEGATLIIKGGGISSNRNIVALGGAKIIMKPDDVSPYGLYFQPNTINMNLPGGSGVRPYHIYNLEVDNPYGVKMTGNTAIVENINLKNGSLFLQNSNLTLRNNARITGYALNKGIVTDGSGYCEYQLSDGNLSEEFFFPLSYVVSNPFEVTPSTRPAPISLKNTGGSLSTGTPTLRAQVKQGRSPNAPLRIQSYTNAYWPIRKSGINSGSLVGRGYYGYNALNDPQDIVGTENEIVGFGYNNVDWLLTGSAQNHLGNYIDATINTTVGEILGMNRFVYLKAKALLHGTFTGTPGTIMPDNLRAGTGGNLIPLTDPYRTTPYNNVFTHVNNAVAEETNASVFYDQTNANDNIVDWVFVEIRNAVTSGSTILQTRSALIQRDGDIVDIDGKSPLYFKNLNEANYTVTIRHRNHLSMSTNNAGGRYARMSNLSYLSDFDFTTAEASNLLGLGNNNNTGQYHVSAGIKYMIGGNANGIVGSNRIAYSGSANDASYILTVLGNSGAVLNNVYSQADINMDGRVSFSGSNNDPSFLLNRMLQGFPNGYRNEIKPK